MNLYLIAQTSELDVNINLLWRWLLARPLELNQHRTTSRQPEDSIWIPGVARCYEFGTFNAEMRPN